MGILLATFLLMPDYSTCVDGYTACHVHQINSSMNTLREE